MKREKTLIEMILPSRATPWAGSPLLKLVLNPAAVPAT